MASYAHDCFFFFFLNNPAPPESSPLPLPAALPISVVTPAPVAVTAPRRSVDGRERVTLNTAYVRALERSGLVPLAVPTMIAPDRAAAARARRDRKSTRLNSSHGYISYAVFCLKKKK